MPEVDDVVRAMAAWERNAHDLRRYPNVLSTGMGARQVNGKYTDEVCVQVFVSRKYKPEELSEGDRIPREVTDAQGRPVRTDVIEVGAFRPAQLPDGRPYDPVVAGCSIGRENGVDAGTLGGWAYDLDRDRIVLLTNNHVLTPRGARRRPPTDSGVVQPGWLMFTGVPRRIGSTARVVEMATHPSDPYGPPFTPVDAAIATIDVPFDYRIAELDVPAIFETRAVGPMDMTPVQKRGIATGLTRGTIVTPFMDDIEVDFGAPGPPEWARFPRGNVFRVDGGHRPFASAGDSGSLVLAQTPGRVRTSLPVLGLIFARDPVGNVASACRIGPVMHHLNLATLCEGAARTLVRASGIRQ